jgi:RNA polymerase sigma-70 factor (ECF subfamily)
MTVDDLELVARVVDGDQQAFLALYDRYAGQIYSLTIRILQDSMLAEEATQDTFLKLWNHASQYLAARGSLLIWMLTIARRTALDRIRMEKRRPFVTGSTDADEMWAYISDGSKDSEEERWRSMYLAVQDLPMEQRQVIDLAYYQGMSQSDIAATLNWPLGTVKTRLRSGMEKLRQAWQEK